MQLFHACEARECRDRLQGGCERGEAATHRQTCFARFPCQPESADLSVQIEDGVALKRSPVGFAAKHGVDQQRFAKAILQIPGERQSAVLNAVINVLVKHQRLQSERVSHCADRQRTVGQLQELKDGEAGPIPERRHCPTTHGEIRFEAADYVRKAWHIFPLRGSAWRFGA